MISDPRSGRTSAGRPRAIAVAVPVLGLLTAALLTGATWFTVLKGGPTEGIGELLTLLLALQAYLVVGLVLLAKTPRNPLGWVMTAVGVLTSLGSFATAYADYAFAPPGHALPGATLAAWINAWWWFPTISLVFLFVPLLFPNGTPLSPRWRWLHRLSYTLLAVMLITAPLNPTLAGDNYEIPNPIGVAAVGDIEESALGTGVLFALILCTLLSLASLIVRFRRSRGVERQQMKWFVFGAAVITTMMTYEELMMALGLEVLTPDSNVAFGIAVAVLPITIGFAVLRYRLYDIDRIISRTLSYGVVSAVLVAVYLAVVTVLTSITAPVTGRSPLAVAAATLLAAAAFGPLRRRVQAVVDRRFNRARYDAARTVDRYRNRIRDEVDLTTVTADLLSTVEESVQPARTTIWLRNEAV